MPAVFIPSNLQDAIFEGRFNDAILIIKGNKKLINSVEERTGVTLLQALMLIRPKSLSLIQFIITHPLFEPLHVSNIKDGLTNFKAIVRLGRLDILQMMPRSQIILCIEQSGNINYVQQLYSIAWKRLIHEIDKKSSQIEQAKQVARLFKNILTFLVETLVRSPVNNCPVTTAVSANVHAFHSTPKPIPEGNDDKKLAVRL